MKLRFLALLVILSLGSAAVLLYASQTRHKAPPSTSPEQSQSQACPYTGAHAATLSQPAALDDCCAQATTDSGVATLSASGCPYLTSHPQAASVAMPEGCTMGEDCAMDGHASAAATMQVDAANAVAAEQ